MCKLEVKNLYFSYPNTCVINDISIKFESSKIYCLLGKNGVGKTTFLKLIADTYKPDKGIVEYEGKINLVKDKPNLINFLTVKEHLHSLKDLVPSFSLDQSYDLLKKFGLEDKINTKVHKLSLGMKYKLMLISNLVLDYDIYLLDEPFTALDIHSQDIIKKILREKVKQGKIIIMVTHLLHNAYELSNEFLLFDKYNITKIENSFKSIDDLKASINDLGSVAINITK